MAITREIAGITMPITATLDQRSITNVVKQIGEIDKRLKPTLKRFQDIAATATLNVKNINKLSEGIAGFTKGLSNAAKQSVQKLSALGDEIGSLQDQAESLKDKWAAAPEGKEKATAHKELTNLNERIGKLNSEFGKEQKYLQKFGGELKKATDAAGKNIDTLKRSAAYGGKEFSKDFAGGLQKMFSGGKEGFVGGLKDLISSTGKGAVGVRARGVEAAAMAKGGAGGAADMAAAGGQLAKVGGTLAVVALAIGAVVAVIKAASDHMTKLNKALIDGVGSAGDLVMASGEYRKSVQSLVSDTISARNELLRFGTTSEQSLKIISTFAKESTGSLGKTRMALEALGEGSARTGILEFTKAAVGYGKALGMEATDVASMMGKFVSEAGYGATQVTDLMGNIVQAAAHANMPLTKFMGIFHSVIPDLELYQNRMEELTGTIRLLSKTMSAKDVKNFMDAFAKGFKGTDFKQRMRAMFIADSKMGKDFTSGVLKKDFEMKANVLGDTLAKQGFLAAGEFAEAFKQGKVTEVLAKAQAAASKKGMEVSGATIGDAMKLAGYEASRKKGGLGVVTAMSGAGMYGTYKILKAQSQAFTTGFDGIAEHVIKATGVTEQQYDALRTMEQSMEVQKGVIQKYGKTNSKSMNNALREAIRARKIAAGEKAEVINLKEFTEEDLFQAAEIANGEKAEREKAINLAAEQYDMTSSVADKLENYIGFLLEKIYQTLQPMLDVISDMWAWISGSKAEKESIKSMKKFTDAVEQNTSYSKEQKAHTKAVSETMGKSMGKSSYDAASDFWNVIGGKFKPLEPDKIKKLIKVGVGDQSIVGEDKASEDKRTQAMIDGIYDSLQSGSVYDAMAKMKEAGMSSTEQKELLGKMGAYLEATETSIEKTTLKRESKTKTYKGLEASRIAKVNEDLEVLEDLDVAPAKAIGAPVPVGKEIEAGTEAPTAKEIAEAKALGAPAKKSAETTSAPVVDTITSDLKPVSEEHVKVATAQLEAAEDQNALLKKGVKFEQSFLNTKFKNVTKEATRKAFDDSLRDFTFVLARLIHDPEYAKSLGDTEARKLKWEDIVASSDEGALKKAKEAAWAKGTMQFQAGGPVPTDMTAKVHGGEFVVPKGGALVAGGKTLNQNITIYAQGVSANEIAIKIDELSRQS